MDVEEKEQYLHEAMEQHGDYIKRLIFTYVQDIQKTEDLVQEVFIKFYNSLERFEGRSTIKTYLYRIAVNECKNYLNSWHCRKLVVTEKIRGWKNRASAEAEYLRMERHEHISELVSSLPIKYREVIWLYYYMELSVSEIAEVLACPANTVKTRLTRGRKLARLWIEESEGGYEYER